MKTKTEIKIGDSFLCSALTFMFVYLKLTGQITWSWWWVLAPTWIPICLVLVIVILMMIGVCAGGKLNIRRTGK